MAAKFNFVCQNGLMNKDCLGLFTWEGFWEGVRIQRNQLVLSAMDKKKGCGIAFAICGSLKIGLKEYIGSCMVVMRRDHIPGGKKRKAGFERTAMLKKSCEWSNLVLKDPRLY